MTRDREDEAPRPAKRYAKGAVPIAVLLVVGGIAWGPPLVAGRHLGYNAGTDYGCETRLGLQWCWDTQPEAQAAPATSSTSTFTPPPPSPEAEEKRKREEAAVEQRRQREEAEQPKREAEARKQGERESLESEGKTP
jgi:hypothetical protein